MAFLKLADMNWVTIAINVCHIESVILVDNGQDSLIPTVGIRLVSGDVLTPLRIETVDHPSQASVDLAVFEFFRKLRDAS